MRCWSLPDGRLLVEETEGRFVVLTADGRLDRICYSGQSSVQEYLNTSLYTVENGELVHAFTAHNTDSDRKSESRDVELRGLVPARAEGVEARVREMWATQKKAGRERKRAEAEKLAAFERGLPPTADAMDFVFTYEGRAIVVRGPGDVEVWRESGYPYHGKHRFAELGRVLRRRYGKSLRSFKTRFSDMAAEMLFNPD